MAEFDAFIVGSGRKGSEPAMWPDVAEALSDTSSFSHQHHLAAGSSAGTDSLPPDQRCAAGFDPLLGEIGAKTGVCLVTSGLYVRYDVRDRQGLTAVFGHVLDFDGPASDSRVTSSEWRWIADHQES